MIGRSWKVKMVRLPAIIFACGIFIYAGLAQSNQSQTGSAADQPPNRPETTSQASAAKRRIPGYLSSRSVPNANAVRYYQLIWGIEDIEVKQVSSGALILFKFRVVNPQKAKVINNEASKPLMIDEASHAALEIPVLEQIGKLRQTNTPQEGREYSMLFSNRGGYVKPGNRVSVVIGTFHLEGLIVQ